MVQDEKKIVHAKFNPTLDVRNYIEHELFRELERGQMEETLKKHIEEVNIAGKKEGWQLKLVEVKVKNETDYSIPDYWIMFDGKVPKLKHPKILPQTF